MKYTEITTVEAAFNALGRDVNALPDFSMLPEKHQKPLLDHVKLVTVIEALNEEWKPDYSKGNNQRKYEIWFDVIEDKSKPSGFGLSLRGVDHWCSHSTVGSRLCFVSIPVAEHAFKYFRELFESYYVG